MNSVRIVIAVIVVVLFLLLVFASRGGKQRRLDEAVRIQLGEEERSETVGDKLDGEPSETTPHTQPLLDLRANRHDDKVNG